MKKRIGLQGTLVFLSFALAVLFSKYFFPAWKSEIADELLDVAGMAVVLLGFLFRFSARGYKSENSDNGKKLITGGPYSLMRNPMYFGTFLIGAGTVLILFNWLALLVFIAGFLMIYVPQVRREERKLSVMFGGDYIKYREKTPGLFPRASGLLGPGSRERLPLKWPWVKRDLLNMALLLIIIIGIEAYEDLKLFGRVEYVYFFLAIIFFFGIIYLVFFNRGRLKA